MRTVARTKRRITKADWRRWGRKGGRTGGRLRALALTPERRAEIAKKGGEAKAAKQREREAIAAAQDRPVVAEA